MAVTVSDHAETAFLLQSALGIVIGDAGGDAHPTGLGTGAPLSGLHQAVLPEAGGLGPGFGLEGWIFPVNCHSLSVMNLLVAPFADPLFTASVGHFDSAREGTVWGREPHPIGTEWDAADGPIHADALQLAAGLEALPVQVNLPQQITGCPLTG